MTQKFFRGDLVEMLNDEGLYGETHAVIDGTYNDLCGNPSKRGATIYQVIFVKSGHAVAWFSQDDMKLVEADTGWKKLPKNNRMRKTEEAREARRNGEWII